MITSRMPRADYDRIQAMSITRLKEMRRSPQHYQHALAHPKESDALTLGIATHVAVLEPERFVKDFATWDRRTAADAMAPRRGQFWDEFCEAHAGRTILTPNERDTAQAIAKAVRGSPLAMRYLESGDPEVTMEWTLGEGLDARKCKGRVDWVTAIAGERYIVGFKTARDCRHFQFASQAAKLGYHLQWAWYADAYQRVKGPAKVIEIVAESEPPHAVAVYRIPADIIMQGRDEYGSLLEQLAFCEGHGDWPGPQPTEEDLSLPSWAYGGDADDDIADIGLEQ
jgi:hypothetical protein